LTPIKVAHITTIDSGLRSLLLNQLLAIQAEGYDVTGISSPGVVAPVVEKAGIRHIAVPMTRNFTPLHDLVSLWRLYRVIRRERFTIVHTHNPKPGLLGQIAARLAGVPIVVNTLHGFYFHDHMSRTGRRFYVLVEKVAALCSDIILSQNREDVRTAIKENICDAQKILRLGNGIDLRRFDPERVSTAAVARLREEFGLPEDAFVVGCVARLVQEKGILEILEAARLVRKRVPNVRFLFIGPQDTVKADVLNPRTAEQYGVEDICHFVGPRLNLPELYSLMDLFVLPSHREGFPRTPMEASAMKIPCILSDIRGCREAVEHERNGLLVPLRDVTALSNAVVRLFTDQPTARRMGEEGRRLAEERFDERAVFHTVIREYARLVQEKNILCPTSSPGTKPRARSGPIRWMYRRWGKRALDLAIVVPALIVLAPLIFFVGLLVRIKLGAPALFRQERGGFRGKGFRVVKFRTMIDAYDDGGTMLPDEHRTPSFGLWLRSTSLDELPTLLNVLRGEMSIVGPRPLFIRYLDRYTDEQRRRHEVKPGITGLAQVRGRNSLLWDQKFALDVYYVDHLSLRLDLKIIAWTIIKTFTREGISQEGYVSAEEFMGVEQ